GPLEVRHIGQILFQDQGLVIGPVDSAVAPAENRDAPIQLPIKASDILDARRLTSSSHRQVADAHYSDRCAPARLPAALVESIAYAHGPAIRHACQPKSGALEAGSRALRLTADQSCVVVCGILQRSDSVGVAPGSRSSERVIARSAS